MNIIHIGIASLESKNRMKDIKSIGGIQGYIIDLIKILLINGIEVTLIGKIFNYDQFNTLKYYEAQKKITSTNKFLLNLFFKSFFLKLPKKALIHAHRPDHYLAFALFKKNLSIISLHGQQHKTVNDRKGKLTKFIYNYMEKIALKKCNYILAVDEITKSYYLNLYPFIEKKIYVVPTGVDTKLFKNLDKISLRKKMGFNTSHKIITYVGRIEPPKRVEEIVKAFKILNSFDNLYRLILVGGGSSYEKVLDLVKKLNIEDSVIFMGVKNRIDLPEIYSISDVSVLYSYNEGSPLSIKESLACGVPVVANDVGDISTVVFNNYNGYIIENESIEELSNIIKKAVLYSDNLRKNCIDSIENYSLEKVNLKIIDIYRLLLDDEK